MSNISMSMKVLQFKKMFLEGKDPESENIRNNIHEIKKQFGEGEGQINALATCLAILLGKSFPGKLYLEESEKIGEKGKSSTWYSLAAQFVYINIDKHVKDAPQDIKNKNKYYGILLGDFEETNRRIEKIKNINENILHMTLAGGLNYIINLVKANNKLADEIKEEKIDKIKQCIKTFEQEVLKMANLNKIELLKKNYQLILTGAPGTGKTYMAMHEIADEILGKNADKENQVKLIQFHPSYDYTDFVEGIKPVLTGGSGIQYELKNGVFKEFCRRAGVIERIVSTDKLVSEDTINEYLRTKLQKKKINEFWENWVNENRAIVNEYNNNPKNDETKKKLIKNLPKFLLIIDEINRAEISKVIGEIMFSIDADYRGIKGKVETQYSSSSDENTFFINTQEDAFFIPSNVYIVGTMNNIDRSVEVFDFALRRRFAWYEVKANEIMEEVLESMLKGTSFEAKSKELADKAKLFNECMVTELKLRSDCYHLGPAYFGKIKNYDDLAYDEALKALWDNHLFQIINEYSKSGGIKNQQLANLKDNFIKKVGSISETTS